MTHYPEEILHLYVLGSPEIADRRRAIEAHLSACAGCRSTVSDLAEFHRAADAEPLALGEHSDSQSPIVIRPEYVERSSGSRGTSLARFGRQAWQFARQRPAAGIASGLCLAAALIVTFAVLSRDDAPYYFFVNRLQGAVQVFNKSNQVVWSLPARAVMKDPSESMVASFTHQSVLVDIDGDGKKEFLTFQPLGDETTGTTMIHVYSSDGRLKSVLPLPSPQVHFRTYQYARPFIGTFLTSIKSTGGPTEIVARGNNSRSPTYLLRYDKSLHEIGSYWHFGQFECAVFDAEPGGRPEVVFYGRNDVDDITNDDFPVIGTLDVDHIVGETESTATPGFGFVPSTAERHYVRFLKSDVERVTGLLAGILDVEDNTDSTFSVDLSLPDAASAALQYVFLKRDWSVNDIKYNQGFVRIHNDLLKSGKIDAAFDTKYLQKLKGNVQYWDGNRWQTNPVVVRHAAAG